MRHSDDESPTVVLERLYKSEPVWLDHPKVGRHPAASGISAAHETRESFQRRHAAWEAAVARERAMAGKVDG